jgi:hypothetical protein
LVIWGVVRRKNIAVKFATRPTWRSASRISPTVFPPPAAPPYMQMSAGVRRNSVWGPGWAEIGAVHDVDIRHTPSAEADCPGYDHYQEAAFSICTGPGSGSVILILQIWPGCWRLIVKQA